jgi:hypothetical protein
VIALHRCHVCESRDRSWHCRVEHLTQFGYARLVSAVTVSPDEPGQSFTPRQRSIIAVIHSTIHAYGRLPTNREIADAIGLATTTTVDYHLREMIRSGFATTRPS